MVLDFVLARSTGNLEPAEREIGDEAFRTGFGKLPFDGDLENYVLGTLVCEEFMECWFMGCIVCNVAFGC